VKYSRKNVETDRKDQILPTPYDVVPSVLIERLAKYLKNNVDEVKPPEWAPYVKTSVHAQGSPEDPDWWFTRCASLLRKIYVKGPVGTEHLRFEYGGRKGKGTRPEHAKKGSGTIIRKALQQLQSAGLVETSKRGRSVTKKGRQLLDTLSTEIDRDLQREHPQSKK